MEQFEPVCLSALTSHEHVKQIKHHLFLVFSFCLSLLSSLTLSCLSCRAQTDLSTVELNKQSRDLPTF